MSCIYNSHVKAFALELSKDADLTVMNVMSSMVLRNFQQI
ncbi:hypothetical protein IC006_2131 [Sulfuracidifex tepidarius]|uniref:Uncharacterized protein n=1 Tax=Sulfuracidifex tepidarius TaxID=1294262 RepID=A0A510DX64_9CREN|nr:hypothetical protein IC006_2131 [Sulfuracidifex tepidarius]